MKIINSITINTLIYDLPPFKLHYETKCTYIQIAGGASIHSRRSIVFNRPNRQGVGFPLICIMSRADHAHPDRTQSPIGPSETRTSNNTTW